MRILLVIGWGVLSLVLLAASVGMLVLLYRIAGMNLDAPTTLDINLSCGACMVGVWLGLGFCGSRFRDAVRNFRR